MKYGSMQNGEFIALDSFRDVRRMVVSLDDLNGPKGGMDRSICGRVRLRVCSGGRGSQMNWHAAIAGEIHRLSQKASAGIEPGRHAGPLARGSVHERTAARVAPSGGAMIYFPTRRRSEDPRFGFCGSRRHRRAL